MHQQTHNIHYTNYLGFSYRYGFNGMERDDEWSGSGNSYDFGARIYDSRLGRWYSCDVLAKKFPSYSPYLAVANSPIIVIDIDGRDLIKIVIKTDSKYIKGQLTITVDENIVGMVEELIKYAIDNKIYIHINSSFRTSKQQSKHTGNKYGGAKAGTSRHEAGFALDFNICDASGVPIKGNKGITSDHAFIRKAKELGFRWGGEFNKKDPIHIDAWAADEVTKFGYASWKAAYLENQNDTDIPTVTFEYNSDGTTSPLLDDYLLEATVDQFMLGYVKNSILVTEAIIQSTQASIDFLDIQSQNEQISIEDYIIQKNTLVSELNQNIEKLNKLNDVLIEVEETLMNADKNKVLEENIKEK